MASSSSSPEGLSVEDYDKIYGSESGWVEARASCHHLTSLSADLTHIPTPDTPCNRCQDPSENWLCLSCKAVLCSRHVNKHMLQHFTQTNHSVVLSLSDLSVWCYPCNAYLDAQVIVQLRPVHEVAYLLKLDGTRASSRALLRVDQTARNSHGSSSNHNQGSNGGSTVQNAGAILDPSLDPRSPYYVHPNESPTAIVVTPPFSGENYHTWARKMRRVLASKNKYKFVDGSICVPANHDPSFEAWERCNNMIHSWIMNSLSPSIAQSVVYIGNAVDVWNDLKERFSQGDLIRVAELRQEINAFKQGTLSVSEFFTELRSLWEELEHYRPMPQCTCPIPCVCLAIRNARMFHQQDQVIHFLMGLNEQFHGVRSQILLMESLPMLNKAFSMVLQQERQSQYGVIDESRISVNAIEGEKPAGRGGNSFSKFGRNGSEKVCTYCGKVGHTIEVCHKKRGYPPSYGRGNAYANNSVSEEKESVLSDRVPPIEKENVDFGPMTFTRDQYNSLLALIQKTTIDAARKGHSSNVVKATNSCDSAGEGATEDDWFG